MLLLQPKVGSSELAKQSKRSINNLLFVIINKSSDAETKKYKIWRKFYLLIVEILEKIKNKQKIKKKLLFPVSILKDIKKFLCYILFVMPDNTYKVILFYFQCHYIIITLRNFTK